ncbi:MAG: head GIN domain-containing protein [Ferruginibacter sp.]
MRLLTLLLMIVCLAACSGKRGSGDIVSETRNTGTFNSLKVSGDFLVEVVKGPTAVKIDADDNLIRSITTEVDNGLLTIRSKDQSIRNANFKVFITTPEMQDIQVSASATVNVNDNFINTGEIELESSSAGKITAPVDCPNIKAEASSGSNINISGRTRDLKVSASSGSSINARNLMAEDTKVNVSSGADADVHASVHLNASASSGGSIHYTGNAKVQKSVSSGGSVSQDQ